MLPISLYKTYRHNLRHLSFRSGSRILDIGAGSCVLKKVFNESIYTAIEPQSHDISVDFGIRDSLIKRTWPTSLDVKSFDYIFCLTTLDEVENKKEFLLSLLPYMTSNTKLIIATRNSDFWFRLNRSVKTLQNTEIEDLSVFEYQTLLKDSFIITDIRKFMRPILFLRVNLFFKTSLLRFLHYILPLRYNYMIMFELKKANNCKSN